MESLVWRLVEWRGELALGLLAAIAYISVRCLLAARKAQGADRHRLLACGIAAALLLPAGIHPALGILPVLAILGITCLAAGMPGKKAWVRRPLTAVGLVVLMGSAGCASTGQSLLLGSGPSMWPTSSRSMSLFLMERNTADYARGDLVTFGVPMSEAAPDEATGWPAGRYHKRLIGLPGDRVELDDYTIRVNGAKVADCHPEQALEALEGMHNYTWVCSGHAAGHSDVAYRMVWGDPEIWMNGHQAWTLGPDEVLVLGDNLVESADSRYRGPIPQRWLVGRVSQSW